MKLRNRLLKSFSLVFFAVFTYWLFDEANQEKQLNETVLKEQILENEIAGIARIVDGDSIVINKNRIRLNGIDAPEAKQKCLDKNDEQYYCGTVSTQFLKDFINNEIVNCFYSKKDIYDRFLATCYVKNIEINEEMLKSGMAIIYDHSLASNRYLDAETSARNNKLGIWQGTFQRPKDFRKSKKK